VTLEVVVNGFVAARREVDVLGGEEVQAPIQALLNIRARPQTIGLAASALYSSAAGPGDVAVGPISFIGVTLPRR
jgi:hypothetical protein